MASQPARDVVNVFYFGCRNGECGHYLFFPGMRHAWEHIENPWGYTPDGTLAPKVAKYPGDPRPADAAPYLAAVHHKDGWSAIAFWDNSVDNRPGSNSVFMVDVPDLSFREICLLAEEHFPQVWKRFTVPIREYAE